MGPPGSRINQESAKDRHNRTKKAPDPVTPIGGVDTSEKRMGPAPSPVKQKSHTPSGPLGGVGPPGSTINGGGGSVMAGKPASVALREQQEKQRAAAQAAREAAAAQQPVTQPVGDVPDASGDVDVTDDADDAEDVPEPPDGLSANQSAAWDLVHSGWDDDEIAEDVGVKASTVARWRKDWDV